MNRNSVVTPNIDLSKVEAINQKRTLAFINHWVLHTVAFLNQFSAVCEEKLISLDTKLRRADHSLAILEAKLNSVPNLEGVVAPTIEASSGNVDTVDATNTSQTETVQNQPPASGVPSATPPDAPQTGADASVDAEGRVEEDESIPAQPSATPISKDPRFAQYFKMLAVGVPLPAVRMKMSSEGLDPSLLDDPNAPAPAMSVDEDHTQDDSDSSSVSSFSD